MSTQKHGGKLERLSGLSLTVLLILKCFVDAPKGESLYGLAIARKAEIPSGSVYLILSRLERRGYLVSEWEVGDPHILERKLRHFYWITDEGREDFRLALQMLVAD